MSSLQNARIIGFFSIPSASLAEHNPSAYTAAMAALPAGAGCCSQCGMGLVHHIVIKDGDTVRFIGQDCAKRVGVDPEAIRLRLTSEERAARDAARAARYAAIDAAIAEREAKEQETRAIRREKFADILSILRASGSEFHTSLADQLEVRPLSWKQAGYAVKATSETGRRNKKNAAAWDEIYERVQS